MTTSNNTLSQKEQELRDEAISFYSDTYKEIHNFRPRGKDFSVLSTKEIQDLTDELYASQFEEKETKTINERIVENNNSNKIPANNPFAALKDML